MADIENKYYSVATDGVDSQPVTRQRWFKVGIALSIGSGFALLSIVALSTSEPTHSVTSAADDLFLRASGGAVKPSSMNSIGSVLPGSGPWKNLALAALEFANCPGNHARDVSMNAMKNVVSNMDAQNKQIVVRAEEAAEEMAKEMTSAVTLNPKEMAGVTAPMGFFDPWGFCTDIEAGRLLFFREVELKHGRVGMLASVGILVAEKFHPLFGGDIDVPAYIAFQQTPLQQFWVAVALAIAIPEFASIQSFQPMEKVDSQIYVMKTDRVPGDLGFDPLGIKPKEPKAYLEMQNKELNNGRLGMLAAAGMIAQELATGQKIFP
jgi:hypothetical protein